MLTFKGQKDLEEYLEEEALMEVNHLSLKENIRYFNESIDDPFTKIRYSIYGGLVYLTIDPPNTYYCESEDNFFLFIRSHKEGFFYILMDNIFDDGSKNMKDIVKDFKENIDQKSKRDIMTNESTGSVVTFPLFEHFYQGKVNSTDGISVKCSIVWREYLKGVREIPEEAISSEAIAPFYVGLLRVDEDDKINLCYLLLVEQGSELKK